MRRQIGLLVAATTSAVVLAFVIPLCLLVRNMAEDRAMAGAAEEARNIAILVSSLHADPTLPGVVAAVDQRSPATTTVVLATGTTLGSGSVPADDADVESGRAGSAFTRTTGDGARTVVPVVTPDGTDVVVTDVNNAQLHQGVLAAWVVIIGLGLLLLAAASVVAVQLGRRISTPLIRVAGVADRLREGDLGARAPLEGPHETRALAEALNRLAERITELLVAERAAVGDLSHRLRTPVTALRIDVEGVRDPALAERLRQHVGNLQRSIDAIVNEARRPVRHDMASTCDAVAVVRDRVHYWAPLAEDQGRNLSVDLPPEAAVVPLDEVDLRDVVDVLIDNVFAHTPEGTEFAVTVRREQDDVLLVVADRGPGPTPRGRREPGHTGLGLEIVRRSVEPAGGRVEIGAAPKGGTVVGVRLPLG
ncbi:MAG TPA: HAMP domain-containing sensor histidine kinase [Marmoricola sp.]|nr:HAMP domain-containing sensor histidine kinase [Marmoricola sp.]